MEENTRLRGRRGSVKIGVKTSDHIPLEVRWVEHLGLVRMEVEKLVQFLQDEEITLDHLKDMREAHFNKLRWPISPDSFEVLKAAWKELQQPSGQGDGFLRWGVEEVCAWLRENGWQEYETGFRENGVIGLRLLVLTESDLKCRLSVQKMGVRLEMISALEKLFATQLNALDVIAEQVYQHREKVKNEFLAVRLQGQNNELMLTKGRNWLRLKKSCSTDKISPVVAFAGPTASGKSRLLSSLLSFDDRMNSKMPLVAKSQQVESTSGNVSLYFGSFSLESEKEPSSVILLDLEGENGTIPQELAKEFRQQKGSFQESTDGAKEELKKAISRRMDWVKQQLPQLAYLVSNVIVFVDRQPMHNNNYIDRVIDFASRALPAFSTSDQPHLILVQNFCAENDAAEFDPDKTTEDFHALTKQHSSWREVEKTFASTSFIKIPDATKDLSLFFEQVSAFHGLVQKVSDPSQCFRLSKQNGFTQDIWFKLVDKVVVEFKAKEVSINMSQMFFKVCKPRNYVLKHTINFFDTFYAALVPPHTTLDVSMFSSDKILPYAKKKRDTFQACLEVTIKKLAELLVLKIVEEKQDVEFDLGEESAKSYLLGNFVAVFEFLMNRAPCNHYDSSFVCVGERMTHPGHQIRRPKFKYTTKSLYKRTKKAPFKEPPIDRKSVEAIFLRHAERVLAVLADEKHDQERAEGLFQLRWNTTRELCRLKTLNAGEEKNDQSIRTAWCLICLSSVEVAPLDCGHTICRLCDRDSFSVQEKFRCPVTDSPAAIVEREPWLPRPRVLLLDGVGNRVVVCLRILQKIEELTSFKIRELFDFVSASRTSALLGAMVTSPKYASMQSVEEELAKLMALIPSPKGDTGQVRKASADPPRILEQELSKRFDYTLIDLAWKTEYPQLLLVAHNQETNKPFLFGSFIHRKVDKDGKVSQAVASCIMPKGVPGIFYKNHHLCIVPEKTQVLNPPIAATIVKDVWPAEPSILLTLGAKGPAEAEREVADKEQQGQATQRSEFGFDSFLPHEIEEVSLYLIAQALYIREGAETEVDFTISQRGLTDKPHFVFEKVGNHVHLEVVNTTYRAELMIILLAGKSFDARLKPSAITEREIKALLPLQQEEQLRTYRLHVMLYFTLADGEIHKIHIAGSPSIVTVQLEQGKYKKHMQHAKEIITTKQHGEKL